MHEGGTGAMSAGMGGEMTSWGRRMLYPLRTALAELDPATAPRQSEATSGRADNRSRQGRMVDRTGKREKAAGGLRRPA